MPSGVWLLFGRQEVANATFAFDLVIFFCAELHRISFQVNKGEIGTEEKA